MPELPDVACFKHYLDAMSLHQVVAASECRDEQILNGVSRQKLQQTIHGRSFERSVQHGKYLFVALAGADPLLVFHFGMTGSFKAFQNPEDCPDLARFVVHFQTGLHLAFVCPRKLGRITLAEDLETFCNEQTLGPDALSVDWDVFRERFRKQKGMVKSALMNQSVLAGIGNVYSDEILFQCGWHPRRLVGGLKCEELLNLYRTMRRVLGTAIRSQADPVKMPGSYLTAHREGDRCCPQCGEPLSRVKVNGRTSRFCRKCQKR